MTSTILLIIVAFLVINISLAQLPLDEIEAIFRDNRKDISRQSSSFDFGNEIEAARNLSTAALTSIRVAAVLRQRGISFSKNDKLPRQFCPIRKQKCVYEKYQRIDGRCTNVWKPLAGSELSPFSRKIPAFYDDDLNNPRGMGLNGSPLPSVSTIEKTIYRFPPNYPVPLTQLFIDFSEFIYEDISRIAHFQDSLSCCSNGNSECIPVDKFECYIRSMPSPIGKCTFARREQLNLATSFLDAGPVYQNFKGPDKTIYSHFTSGNTITSLLRAEHDWVVTQLMAHFPSMDAETRFNEARKFVIAELQHIVLREYLPILLGEETIHNFNLWNSYCNDKSCEHIDVNTLNEFSTVGQFFSFMTTNSINISPSSAKIVYSPSIYTNEENNLATTKSRLSQLILQERDHGIATYSKWRQECGGGDLSSFDDLLDLIDEKFLNKLSKIYSTVEDVELILLGLAENPVYGALLGPTFGCILGIQFQKMKFGDSYWYEKSLTEKQLKEIQKTSISSLVCRHQKKEEVPLNAFIIADEFGNTPISCNTSSTIDIRNWIELDSRETIVDKFDDVIDFCVKSVNDVRSMSTDSFHDTQQHAMSIGAHARMMLAKDEAVVEANISLILLEATHRLIRDGYQLSEIQGVNVGDRFRSRTIDDCNPKNLPCDPTNPYRTFTGWCNNLEHPSWANTFTELKRLSPPAYDDEIESPRSKGTNGQPLPSPRLISNTVHSAAQIEHVKYTHLLMEFGQFIDHDITHSPVDQNPDGTPLNCSSCDSFNTVSSSCYPIRIPENDKFFEGSACMSFTRSLPAQKNLGYRNQMNQITSYLDGSVMYGSTECEGRRLRTFADGKLKRTNIENAYRHYGITLPQSDETEQDGCVSSPQYPCFIAGDDRNSQQTLLIAVHSVFHREHDRITDKLKIINAHWDDERLYQETRRIVSAQFSHIVYNQYLPIVIGQKMVENFELRPLKSGYYKGYESCDASILQPFATAAFRFGHSTVTRYTPLFNNGQVENVVDLASEFLNMSKIYEASSVERIINGMHTQRQMSTDRHIDDSVRNFLFSERGRVGTGLDLIAINIQRGRDHGIQPYNHYRKLCGLDRLTSFHSVFSDIDSDGLQAISQVYESPDDVDLFTGIVSEKPLTGAIVGPTAACIIADQFRRLKKCDRFYYENDIDYVKFTPEQLQEIRKVSMSSLICANTKIKRISRDVFSLSDTFLNADIDCKLFEQIDFSKWDDNDDCFYKSTRIPLHSTNQVSACTSCTCTSNGLKCASTRPDCLQLLAENDYNRVIDDALCYMQCAHFIK